MMAMKPYKDMVIGKPVRSKIFESSVLIVPERLKRNVPDTMEVIWQGPLCKEDLEGKVVILPPFGGSVISMTDDETGEEEHYIVISEAELLALVDEELNLA